MIPQAFHHIFIGRDSVIIPTVARTTTGLFLDVEPVVAASISDSEMIRQAIKTRIEQGNPEVPNPSRDGYEPVVCRYAGVKRWSSFIKKFDCIGFTRDDDEFQIEFTGRDLKGLLVDDPSRSERVRASDIVERLAFHIMNYRSPQSSTRN
jgi:hypothetical protein